MVFQSTALPNTDERCHTEMQLLNQTLDFSAAYMAVQYLVIHMDSSPDSITNQTLDALIVLIKSNRFDSQKQRFFLYVEAASALVHMAQKTWVPVTKRIIPQLQKILVSSNDKRQRAVSQALVKLPVRLKSEPAFSVFIPTPLKISLDGLLSNFMNVDPLSIKWQGRSLTFRTGDKEMGIIKFSKNKANTAELINEILWMDFLKKHPPCQVTNFYIPCPVRVENQYLFEILDTQGILFKNTQFACQPIAIAYRAQAHYFEYPNEDISEKKFSNRQIKDIFFKNAHLLGNLTSKGIIHTALIPLFHNRVQQGRRNDNGAYLWEHGGRLDQWLDSCRYPNFASSGLRDFEHLIKMGDSKSLGHYIGEHILSFVLVIGSYFRNKAPSKRGKKGSHPPCDTRDLFDKTLFCELIKGVIERYYLAITGKRPDIILFNGLSELIDSLIEKMGMDDNMEEILRVQDQQSMSETQFAQFLMERGIENTKEYPQGKQDIILMTGPHLGGFSQPISIPALIEFLFCLSSLCVSDRFLVENALKT